MTIPSKLCFIFSFKELNWFSNILYHELCFGWIVLCLFFKFVNAGDYTTFHNHSKHEFPFFLVSVKAVPIHHSALFWIYIRASCALYEMWIDVKTFYIQRMISCLHRFMFINIQPSTVNEYLSAYCLPCTFLPSGEDRYCITNAPKIITER